MGLKFYPDENYQPDLDKYPFPEFIKSTRIWQSHQLGQHLERPFSDEEDLKAYIVELLSDDNVDNDPGAVDVRIIKYINGIIPEVYEHGVFDVEKMKLFWQNPETHPIK